MAHDADGAFVMRTGFVAGGAAGAALLLALIAPGFAAARRAPEHVSRTAPSQNADLPYGFSIDGFAIEVSSADLTTQASAFGQTVREAISEDERWLGVGLTVEEKQGRERLFPWVTMVRLRTALGAIVNAPVALSSEGSNLAAEQETLAAHQRQELRIFFRVKRGDFPVQLVFADGGAAPLGE